MGYRWIRDRLRYILDRDLDGLDSIAVEQRRRSVWHSVGTVANAAAVFAGVIVVGLLVIILIGMGRSVVDQRAALGATPTASPVPFTREQAIAKARADAVQSAPEYWPIETRIDSVDAELLPSETAAQHKLGDTGSTAGVVQSGPVWLVHVRGYFRFQGMPQANGSPSIEEADERNLVYSAVTGAYLGAQHRSQPVGTAAAASRAQATPTPVRENDWAALGQLRAIWPEQSGRVPTQPIAVDPANPQRLAYCTAGAIRLSVDGGRTWSEIPTGSVAAVAETTDYPFMDTAKAKPTCDELLLDPAHPATVYAVFQTVQRPSLSAPPLYFVGYVTADGGKSWQPVPPPAGSTLGQFGGFRVDGTTVKALFHRQPAGDGDPFFSVIQTNDGGRTWTPGQLDCPPAGPCVRFGPAGSAMTGMADVLQPVVRSTDGGTSWAKIANVHDASVRWLPGPHALVALSPTTVAYLSGSASEPFLLSKDGGVTWSAIALPPLPGPNDGQNRFPALRLLPDGVLIAHSPESGGWYLLPSSASQWCPTAGLSLPTTRGVPPTLQVIGDRIWRLDSGSPASVPLSGLGCGQPSTPTTPAPTSTPAAAPSASLEACRAANLSATADWQGAGGSLVGGIVIANRGKTPCTFLNFPRVQLLDANGQDLPVETFVTGQAYRSLQPGQEITIRLSWSNWCKARPAGGIRLLVTVPSGSQEQLTVKDRAVNPKTIWPRCDAPSSPSRLNVRFADPPPTPTPTKMPGQVGFRAGELTDVTEITVMTDAKTAEKTTGDATLVKPVIDALAAARFVGVDQRGDRRDDGIYLVYLKRKIGSPFVFVYRPGNGAANVEDPGPAELWLAAGLDAAMQPLLPAPPPPGPVVGPSRDLLQEPISDVNYRISPDGQWVSYQAGPSAIEGAFRNGELAAHHVEGKVIPLVAGRPIQSHAWFPDSRQLVVVIGAGDGQSGEILIKPLGFPEQAPARTLLKAPADAQGFGEAAVSPDGKWIAFTVLFDASPAPVPKIGIVVINVDGTGRRQIVAPDFFIGNLRWTPDGQQIVYFKGKGGTPPNDGESYVANVDGPLQPPKLLLPRLRLAVWSPDGKQALWLPHPVEDGNRAGLVVTSWPDVNPTRVIAKNVSALGVDWVGSSGWVVFASDGALYLAPSTGAGEVRRLTPENERADRPIWLPGIGIAYQAGSGSSPLRLRLIPVSVPRA